mmetsp:Transcript_20357/g.48298  ORF Transcript_20357/g.48298 Transcript_20357/m.48298 type:complete len:480 (+) Transcript_20357:22-1461(+)
MDPSTLLEVPHVSNQASADAHKNKAPLFQWGHQVDYKSLSLGTLENKGPKTPRRVNNNPPRDPCNQYNEYEGTKPVPFPYSRITSTGQRLGERFPLEPHVKEGINGSQPRNLSKRPVRELLSLKTRDIAGCEPASDKHLSNFKRSTDPLNPKYEVSKATPVEIPTPRFTRDAMNCTDINGSKPTPYYQGEQYRGSTNLNATDIEGTTPRKLFRSAPISDEKEDPARHDVRLPYRIKASTRQTNPLDPRYRYNIPNDLGTTINARLTGEPPRPATTQTARENWTIGEVTQSKAHRLVCGSALHMTPAGRGNLSYREGMLQTEDIVGSTVGTKGRLGMARSNLLTLAQEKPSMQVDDILGAKTKGHFTLLPGHYIERRAKEATLRASAPSFPSDKMAQAPPEAGPVPSGPPREAVGNSDFPQASGPPRSPPQGQRGDATPQHMQASNNISTPRETPRGTPRGGQGTPRAAPGQGVYGQGQG